ncbi:histidine phosphatase family protein [Altererythrobacter confluentis]|uniref:Histidine phosphatase family protein n=1 Tax=Allopontixanthobacter confluentis TaxID=1849021 RepID=A0A6L7GDU1_9SPHN|nr:histidine phosphatase family protein [Allopontixanthobacter confluentis]MXP13750.1 histidine phosphatase family protein [Allopontixanthobacter confluentis]
MKTLGLLRHAKSDWDDMAMRDFDRGLNDRGRKGASLIGKHIARQNIGFDLVLASPAERVQRTLEAALPGLDPVFDQRLYLAGSDTLVDVLREKGGNADAVLIVGHNPGLQELLFALVPPASEDALFDQAASKYPTATFALFELDIDDWADLDEDCGRLVQFTRPRDLDPTLGPEI